MSYPARGRVGKMRMFASRSTLYDSKESWSWSFYSIIGRLSELGWGTEIAWMLAHRPYLLLTHSAVKPPKTLTERSGHIRQPFRSYLR